MKKTITFLIAVLCSTVLIFGQTIPVLEKVGEFWEIDSPEDFIWLADTVSLDANNDGTPDFDSIGAKMDGNYRLIADITFDPDSSKVDWNNDGTIDIAGSDAAGLWPIGTKARDDGSFIPFKGHFDGQYHTISNVYQAYSYTNRSALFGGIQGGTIENLRVVNFKSHPVRWYPCILVGRCYEAADRNVFTRCWVEGTIYDIPTILDEGSPRNSLFVSGIIGRLEWGDVSECVAKFTAHGNTTNQRRIAGITGQMGSGSTIKNSYAIVTITAFEESGAIVGRENSATAEDAIENCYAVGSVMGAETPDQDLGVFAGETAGIGITSCYWDTEKTGTGVTEGIGRGDNEANLIGLATADFATESNFVGWDFTSTWKIGDVDGVQRPYLQWQDLVGEEVSVNDLKNSNLIKVYPNPVSGVLNIENAPINSQYNLTNMIGQTIQSGVVRSNSITLNLQGYEKGIYLLKVGDSVNKILVK